MLRKGDLHPEVQGDERADGEAGEEGDLIEGGKVPGVPHRQRKIPAEAPEGDDEQVCGQLARHEPEDVGADVSEILGSAGGDPVLYGEGAKEEVLPYSTQLEEVRAETTAQADLPLESPVPQLGRNRLPSDEDFSDPASHEANLAVSAARAG